MANGLSRRYPGALLPGIVEVADAEPDTAVVSPLAAAGLDHPAGVLVAGISPFHTLDADYRGFCDLVAGHVGAAVADARAYQASGVVRTGRTGLCGSGDVGEGGAQPAVQRGEVHF